MVINQLSCPPTSLADNTSRKGHGFGFCGNHLHSSNNQIHLQFSGYLIILYKEWGHCRKFISKGRLVMGDLSRPSDLGEVVLGRRDLKRPGGRSSKVEISWPNFSSWGKTGVNVQSVVGP